MLPGFEAIFFALPLVILGHGVSAGGGGGGLKAFWCGGVIFLETHRTFIWDQKEKRGPKKAKQRRIGTNLGQNRRFLLKRHIFAIFELFKKIYQQFNQFVLKNDQFLSFWGWGVKKYYQCRGVAAVGLLGGILDRCVCVWGGGG